MDEHEYVCLVSNEIAFFNAFFVADIIIIIIIPDEDESHYTTQIYY